MDDFSRLFTALDTTTKTTAKLTALSAYFKAAPERDALWALWLLSGKTLRRAVTSTQLKDWAAETAELPRWLFDESYIRVGDLAETVGLVIQQSEPSRAGIALESWMQEIGQLRDSAEADRKAYITGMWRALDPAQRMLFTKLITGSFRVGVSRALTVRALAASIDADAPTLLHALTGNWNPAETSLEQLSQAQGTSIHPYPFFLASPVGDRAALGVPEDWQFEWKWDGIRGQIVRRGDETALWSRGEDLVSEQFPELMEMAATLPRGTVLDGEIMPWQVGDGAAAGSPLPFAVLQTRLGRKAVSAKTMADAPVAFVAYDILEHDGTDLRGTPLQDRRRLLDALAAATDSAHLVVSPLIAPDSWDKLQALQRTSRAHKAEGLMLKRQDSTYQAGRVRGDWWKWKIDPLSIDAVMVNAQRGHGRRSAVYSDYTFAVRDGDQLVPFAKAYSGLTDAEINKVDAFVKRHTLEKFGPVRTVKPELVFEIGFEGIAASKRHKSGVAVRFPRILRQRPDKPVAEIDTVESLQQLLKELS